MYKRFICFFLVFTLVFSSFAFSACKRKQKPVPETTLKNTTDKINLPHYSYDKLSIEYNDNIEEQLKYSLAQVIILNTNQFLALWLPLEENAPSHLKLYSFTQSGVETSEFSLSDKSFFATQILKIHNDYFLYGENETKNSNALYKIDIENLTVTDDLTDSEPYYRGITEKLNNTYRYNFPPNLYTDDYLIANLSSLNNKNFFCIADKNGNTTTKNINELVNLDTDDYSMSDNIFCLEQNTLLFFFHSTNKDTSNIELKFYTLNIDTNDVKTYQLNSDFENDLSNILNKKNSANNLSSFEKSLFFDNTNKHKAYFVDASYIINEIDFKNQSITPILDLNDSYFNISDAEYIKNIFITDDKISLFVNSNDDYFYVFNKSDSNPNIEKSIITLASLTKIKPLVGEAIANYNKNNEEYFIQYFNNYTFDKDNIIKSTDNSYTNSINKIKNNLLSIESNVDIIIDGHNYSRLKNDSFIDLAPKMKELNDDYFQNIIEAAKIDGKLYNLPLTFEVPGMFIDNSKINNLENINYSSYWSLIEEQFNGETLFSSDSPLTNELIIKQMLDNINMNNTQFFYSSKFSTTIDFIKNLSNRNQHEEGLTETSGTATLRNYLTYFNIKKQSTFYPLPSFEKPEFVADITNSVAISSYSKKQDAAWEFIKILLNTAITQYDNFHINRSITRNNDIYKFENKMAFSQNKLQDASIDEIISTGERFINNINKVYQNYDIILFHIVYNEINKYLSNLINYEEMINNIINEQNNIY